MAFSALTDALGPIAASATAPSAALLAGGADIGMSAGFSSAFEGLEHVVSALAVGVLAARIGGVALAALPGAFLVPMGAAALLTVGGERVDGLEFALIAGGIALAYAILFVRRTPLALAGLVCCGFALTHGALHGAEASTGGDAGGYIAGLVAGAGLLIALGVTVQLVWKSKPFAAIRGWVSRKRPRRTTPQDTVSS